jgi:NADPH:quinone reductase-like Zn-dependent oxidoreductase
MRVVEIQEFEGPDVLVEVERDAQAPGPDEVLVRTSAIGVNFSDVWVRLGADREITPPFVPGIEVAGTIEEVGVDVGRGLSVGDFVVGLPVISRGGYAELVVVPAEWTFRVPRRLAPEVAAALPVNYLTAYCAVEHAGRVREGDRVLVQAGAGGVGLAAVQLAWRRGADVYATASPSKHAALLEEGVVEAIDYRTHDFREEIKRLTGDGVDLVVDGVGQDDFRPSMESLRFGGRVIAYGYTAGVTSKTERPVDPGEALGSASVSLIELLSEGRGFVGIGMDAGRERLESWLARLVEWYEAGEIRPRIDSVLPLGDAAVAHERLQERENVGKIVLVP